MDAIISFVSETCSSGTRDLRKARTGDENARVQVSGNTVAQDEGHCAGGRGRPGQGGGCSDGEIEAAGGDVEGVGLVLRGCEGHEGRGSESDAEAHVEDVVVVVK